MAGENSVLYQSDSTTIRVMESAINRQEYVSVGVEFVCSVSVINAIIVRLCEMGQNLPQFTSNDSSEIISPTTYTVGERQIDILREESEEVSEEPPQDDMTDACFNCGGETPPVARKNPLKERESTNLIHKISDRKMLSNA